MNKPKTKIYIDGANIFYAQKKMNWTLDWRKIKEYFLKGFEIIGLTLNYEMQIICDFVIPAQAGIQCLTC